MIKIFYTLWGIVILITQTSLIYAQQNGERETPLTSISKNQNRSDNPAMYLSKDELDAKPARPPSESFVNKSSTVDNPSDTVIYNVGTQEETLFPDGADDQESQSDTPIAIEPFEGLLPLEFLEQQESVLGADGRTQINNTTTFPWRTIAMLRTKYPNDDGIWGCSGAIIDDYHILTAGHCVHNASRGGWASWVRVYPGQDGSYSPYSRINVTFYRSYTGWTNDQNPSHDWAVLTLDRNIGKWTGWMGRRTAASSSSNYTGTLNISGYPCDKPSGTHWFDTDSGHSATDFRHFYFMDTFGCQSGSPVWRLESGNRYILSVHAYGDTSGTPGQTNGGTRLHQAKFDSIISWLAADTPPTDKSDLIDDGDTFSDFSPGTASPGDSINLNSDVRNIGTANSGSFYVSYYASTNTTISAADYFLGKVLVSSITPFSKKDADLTGSLPNNIPEGSYYVGWIIDSDKASDEFNENNNVTHKTSPKLTVTAAPPSAASLISPSGSTSDNTPTYTWNAVSGSTWYYLWVNDSTGNKIQTWYTAAQAGCASGTGTCSITPATTLANGNVTWWIQTWNNAGYGPWSSGLGFNVTSIIVPGKATLVSPSGSTSDNTPTYTWNAVSGSTWYYLWVNDSTGNKIQTWYTAAQVGCASGTGTCSITSATTLANGSATWWIQTWNNAGYGPWSNGLGFNVTSSVLGKATLVSPSGTTSDSTPTYTWNAVSGSTWYYLWVNDSTGNKIQTWYTAAQVGCAGGTGTCSITPSTSLASGSATWWIQTWNSAGTGPWSDAKNFQVLGFQIVP